MFDLSATFITEPFFYAVALPAAFMLGLSKSGFASGFGSLSVPLMALAVSVPQAAAIMLPLLALSDLLGIRALARHADRTLLRRTLPVGLLGIAIGWASFGLLSVHTVSGVVGGVTLLFLAQQLLWPPRADRKPPSPLVTRLLSLASGYTSFVAHAGGPPMAMALLPRRMDRLVYAGTSSVYFTVLNASKWLPYALLGMVDLRNLATSAVLMPVAALGVQIGVWLTKRVSSRWFYRLVQVGMLLTGLKLLYDGLR